MEIAVVNLEISLEVSLCVHDIYLSLFHLGDIHVIHMWRSEDDDDDDDDDDDYSWGWFSHTTMRKELCSSSLLTSVKLWLLSPKLNYWASDSAELIPRATHCFFPMFQMVKHSSILYAIVQLSGVLNITPKKMQASVLEGWKWEEVNYNWRFSESLHFWGRFSVAITGLSFVCNVEVVFKIAFYSSATTIWC